MYVCMYVCMYCVYVFIYVCIYVCMYCVYVHQCLNCIKWRDTIIDVSCFFAIFPAGVPGGLFAALGIIPVVALILMVMFVCRWLLKCCIFYLFYFKCACVRLQVIV